MKQWEKDFLEVESSKENWETSVYKTGWAGWPSLECHDVRVVLVKGEENMEMVVEGDRTKHSLGATGSPYWDPSPESGHETIPQKPC